MTEPRPPKPAENGTGEFGRIVFLAGFAAWVLHPFATARQVGAGDALWYANMLADFCLQWRAGVFPVFVGQTEFAFNGAVYPLRVAPLYQHLGGVLDLLTGRQLGWFALQHLCVIVMGVAGIFSCYFALCALAPNRRGNAAALAALYLSCPGVLGTIYTQDLYMTWMAVPFVPVAVYGAIRAFQHDTFNAQIGWAAGLAALWLAHAPVALWTTFATVLLQAIRLLVVHRNRSAWLRAIGGGILFIALAQYPFVSVGALHATEAANAPAVVAGDLEHAERISTNVREVFPRVLLPVSEHARALSDLQLGYGLWLVLLGAILAAISKRGREWTLIGLIFSCAILLVLLFPVPGNTWLWSHLPGQIRRITFYWPMHRFYLVLGALLAVAGQLALGAWGTQDPRTVRLGKLVLFAGCLWSAWEARQFIAAGVDRTSSTELSDLRQRPENLLLMNHAYGLFPALPAYFSNGTMDPRAEARLLDRETLRPIMGGNSSTPLQPLRGVIDENPGILKLEPTLHLEAGKRYELVLGFNSRSYGGVLQLRGSVFFREYALPASGQALAFGSGPAHAHALPVWTTHPEGEDVTVRFIPTTAGETPADYFDFAQYAFREIAPRQQAVSVAQLLPFQAEVTSANPAWLETPRMFQAGYSANLDGKTGEIRRSPQGLVAVAVPAGTHRVTLEFVGPLALRVSYWATLAAWVMLPFAAFFARTRQLRS